MIGRIVSHYRIIEKLGGGSMGVVYKAEDIKLKRTVALKFLPHELTRNEDSKERFVREAQAASAIDHPNICNVHEIDESPEGQLFICMAHYEGETLKKRIERGPVPVEEAFDTFSKIAQGMAEAHSHGIVHRDIKPANIMLTNAGGVKILDFGLAKLTGRSQVTDTGRTLGTLAYMSPEQARGEEVDARSDIFSLGVVLYELITGHVPFEGYHEAAVLYKIMHVDPEPLAEYQSTAPQELQRIVDKALEKDINRRYQTVAELQDDLQSLFSDLGFTSGRAASLKRHRFRGLIVPAIIVVAVLLGPLLNSSSRRAIKRFLGFDEVPAQMHLVVLPFRNVGDDPANQAFCDGLIETLTSELTQLQQFHGSLWVVPSNEVRRRGIASASEARRVFGVNLVVSGSVQRFSDNFRITLNLIDPAAAKMPRQLNSSVIDDRMTNVSVLQDETVIRMAEMLNVELTQETQQLLTAGGTSVSEAYDFYLQGRGYLQRYEKTENLDYAIGLFEKAIELDSLYALAFASLGEAYWRKYESSRDPQWMKQAVKNCKLAYDMNNLLAPVLVTLGLIYRGTGEYEKAIAEFKRALALDPTSANAYRGLAGVYADVERLEEAESTYKRAIKMRPDYWGGYNDLGRFYYSRGRYEDAVQQYLQVVALTPDNIWGYNNVGAMYYLLERWEEARSFYQRSIEIEPNYRAYSNMGTLYYIEGYYTEAAVMYEKALELNDTSYRTWANLANVYYWIPGKRNEAYNIYRRAAEMAEEQRKINPRNLRVLTSLAGYYVMLGEDEKALGLVEEAQAIDPSDVFVIYCTGYTYEQLGERDKALEWIGKALKEGYPLAEIERDPWLRELRLDDRFQKLLKAGRD